VRLRRMLEGVEARIGIGRAGSSIDSGAVNWLDASLADELSSIQRHLAKSAPRISSKTRRNGGAGAIHMVRYVFRKGRTIYSAPYEQCCHDQWPCEILYLVWLPCAARIA